MTSASNAPAPPCSGGNHTRGSGNRPRRPTPPPSGNWLSRAFESADVDGVVALLTDDVWLTMPPVPLQYQGRELAARFLTATAFRPGWTSRLIATRANGQPAFGFYVRDPQGVSQAIGLLVLTLSGNRICAITRFDNSVLDRFGLPRILPD